MAASKKSDPADHTSTRGESPQEAALVLIGHPPLLRGSIHLANRGADKLKLKSAVLRLKDGLSGDPHVPLNVPLNLQVSARLQPGSAAHTPVSLAIDHRTPPGSYRGEVDFGGVAQAREVLLQVLEHRAVSVQPASFEIYGPAGGRVRLPAVVANLGNVPYTLPKAVPLTIGEENAFGALFHAAMARKGADGHQAALDTFTELLSASEVESGRAVFEADGGRALAPGDTLATEIVFELPDKLSRRRSYHGAFSLGKASCSVDIEVDVDEPAPVK